MSRRQGAESSPVQATNNDDDPFGQDFSAFINDSVAKGISVTMDKMKKKLESSVKSMVSKSLLAHSAGDNRKRKIKDLSSLKSLIKVTPDGATLTGEASSPQIEDVNPPRPPSKRKSKSKHVLNTPKNIVISHISNTDDDMGDVGDIDDNSDIW
ncbi:hypothetical protein NDU88_001734 [Pleurodeles waltl]|uniref:Uncharacterized protein n=1 Tax=Pleurodeles waltl TaxID=8319 RepID=A0AAV7TKI8_PLEWA|nr:hypothetical protein NDU88_001734 [Pleurodeles waltl]